jgi:hypothetical protein
MPKPTKRSPKSFDSALPQPLCRTLEDILTCHALHAPELALMEPAPRDLPNLENSNGSFGPPAAAAAPD